MKKGIYFSNFETCVKRMRWVVQGSLNHWVSSKKFKRWVQHLSYYKLLNTLSKGQTKAIEELVTWKIHFVLLAKNQLFVGTPSL
jgi:hypothetical protein